MISYKSIQLPYIKSGNEGLNYEEIVLNSNLREYIYSLCAIESKKNMNISIIPDGSVTIIFVLTCGKLYKKVLLGPMTLPINVEISINSTYFCIKLLPGIFPRLFGRSMSTIQEKIVDFDSIWKIDQHILEDVFNLGDNVQILHKISDYSLKAIKENVNLDRDIKRVLEYIYINKGQVSINEITEEVCISPKLLNRRFNKWIGLSPKLFCRIIRFQNTMNDILMRKEEEWIKLALNNGYYDQAHFIKEFKNFSGQTPTKISSGS